MYYVITEYLYLCIKFLDEIEKKRFNPKIRTKMNELTKKHETAKQNSINFMKTGQISDYFNALLEMNKYRRLLNAIIAN